MHLINYMLTLGLKHKWRLFSWGPFARESHRGKKHALAKASAPLGPCWVWQEDGTRKICFKQRCLEAFITFLLEVWGKRLQNCRKIFWGYNFLFLFYQYCCNKTSLHFYWIFTDSKYKHVSTYCFEHLFSEYFQ